MEDEQNVVHCSQTISFNLKSLHIPIVNEHLRNPILNQYLAKLGFYFFGENKVGGRFFFVLLGTLGLFFIYQVVKESLGNNCALLTLLLLSIDTYHILTVRFMLEECLLLFFSALLIYLFFKSISTQKSIWIYATSIVLGIGYYAKIPLILLASVFLLFLLIKKNYRIWFKNKDLYIASLIVCLFISPHLIWSFSKKGSEIHTTLGYLLQQGISLRCVYLYFGELFAWITGKIPLFVWDIQQGELLLKTSAGTVFFISNISSEYPFVHWVMSIAIAISIVLSLKKIHRGKDLILFSLIMFLFIFGTISMLGGSIDLLDNHWWASMTIYPGIILCAYQILSVGEKLKSSQKNLFSCYKVGIIGFVLYLGLHCFFAIQITENIHGVPKTLSIQQS